MSCNSCSNVTLPGVAGPAGAAGAAGSDGDSVVVLKIYIRALSTPSTPSGGSYDFSTHTLTAPASWSSGVPAGSDPCYVSNGTASVNGTTGTDSSITWSSPVLAFQNGADGTDGVSLINTITAPVSVSSTSYSSANAIGGTPWSVPLNTLKDTGDTLRLEMTILPTFVDGGEYVGVNVEVASQVIRLWTIAPYDLQFNQNSYANIRVDFIKTSDTTLNIEFVYSIHPQFLSDYSNNLVMGGTLVGDVFSFARSNQSITVPSLIVNNTDVDIQMKVSNASFPAKLLMAKLYFFKKL